MIDIQKVASLYNLDENEIVKQASDLQMLNWAVLHGDNSKGNAVQLTDMDSTKEGAICDVVLLECKKQGYEIPKFYFATTNLCSHLWGIKEPHVAPECGDLNEIEAFINSKAIVVQLKKTKYASVICPDFEGSTEPRKAIIKALFSKIRSSKKVSVAVFLSILKEKVGIKDLGIHIPSMGNVAIDWDFKHKFIEYNDLNDADLIALCNDKAVRWIL